MPQKTDAAVPLPDLRDSVQIQQFITQFDDIQDRREACILIAWFLTDDFRRLLPGNDVPKIRRGSNPPDFLVIAGATIAVEITSLVLPQKAVYDKTDRLPGAYTSTLRNKRPDAAFHAALTEYTLPDDSDVNPHFETVADLDNDYYARAESLLGTKLDAAQHYSPLCDHTVILVEDRLSELEPVIERRLPRLRQLIQSMKLAPSVEVVIMNTGSLHYGVAHKL